jgi:hypothetical protein
MADTDISYIINELGEDRELYFNAVAPPIIQTSVSIDSVKESVCKLFAVSSQYETVFPSSPLHIKNIPLN